MSAVPQDNPLSPEAEENRRLRAALSEAQRCILREQESLRDLQTRLAMVARTAKIWAWEAGTDADFVWDTNRPAELGLDHVAIHELGRRFFEMIEEEDRQQVLLDHAAALQRKAATVVHKYRIRLPDGALRHYEGRGAFTYCEGAATRAMGVNVDVTDEVKAAELLKRQAAELGEAQRRLERASLSSQEGHWDFDLRFGRLWISSSSYQLLGYADGLDLRTREQYLELVHPDDRALEIEAFEAHIARNRPLDIELRIRTAAGEWRWMRVCGMAELDEGSRPVRISGSIQDIHEKKIAEDSLRVVRQRFERAIRGTDDGLWEWDLEHDTFWISPRFEDILGYKRPLPNAGAEFRQFITHPDERESVGAAYQAHFAGTAPLDIEVRLPHARGDYIWARLRGQAEWNAEGRPIKVSGSIQDITEARAAREELVRATAAAQAANRAKSDFLANVSHEIRTPMNGIIGMSALLLETELNAVQLDYVETIRSSGDSLLTVINDILDFSKIEAGKLDIEMLDVDLRRSVEDVGAVMALQAGSKDLDLVMDVKHDVPDVIRGDPQRIRQCLVNLVGNAIKFTAKGEVVLEVSVVGPRHASFIHFEVRDSGIGIDPETAEKLFQPFVQADSSTTRHFGGTGLGLSIVRRLVEMMGGKIGLRSTPGEGSTFWFDLPLDADVPVSRQHSMGATGIGARLLVVDRNPSTCRVIAAQLSAAGYVVTAASDAQGAGALLQEAVASDRLFAAAFIDERVNALVTPALSEQIRGNPMLAPMGMIMLTAFSSRYDHEQLKSRGAAAALAKPVRRRELLACVEQLLSNEPPSAATDSPAQVLELGKRTGPAPGRMGSVLLVEDNAVNQKVASRFLERLGYQVTIANDGAQAVKAYERQSFDVILMDLQMPVMDGYAATEAIRSKERGSRIPIVALTASAMAGQLERCLAANMDGLLTKPLSIDRLDEKMREIGFGTPARREARSVSDLSL